MAPRTRSCWFICWASHPRHPRSHPERPARWHLWAHRRCCERSGF